MSGRKKLVLSTGIVSLAILGGLVTSKVAGGSGVEPPLAPPPMSFAEQASLPVSDENGPMVCGGRPVTVGYVRRHVMKVSPTPPPPGSRGSGPSSTDPATHLPGIPAREQAEDSSYVFRCVDDEVIAIPAP